MVDVFKLRSCYLFYDLTDPAPATTFAHLDATTVLSRGLAAKGIYPAVDPLDSTSTMLHASFATFSPAISLSLTGDIFHNLSPSHSFSVL